MSVVNDSVREVFGTPYTETRYFPTYLHINGDLIVWDASEEDKVIVELEHLLAHLRGGLLNLKVKRVHDACKIYVIKQIRATTGLGLKESKDIADGNEFLRNVTETRAGELVRAWESEGCEVAAFNAKGADVAANFRYNEVPF